MNVKMATPDVTGQILQKSRGSAWSTDDDSMMIKVLDGIHQAFFIVSNERMEWARKSRACDVTRRQLCAWPLEISRHTLMDRTNNHSALVCSIGPREEHLAFSSKNEWSC